MGTQFSTVQRTAIEKFTSAHTAPACEIQATVFDPLGQINWRKVDFSGKNSRDAVDLLLLHSAETHHIPQLFGYVARLLDNVSASASTATSANNNNNATAAAAANAATGTAAGTTSAAKESAAQLQRTAFLCRLAAILLFNAIQQCAGNPFALLRLTNSPNEEAMSMLGAAAEFVVRVPFSAATALLHVEAMELIRFSFSTRLYGTSLTAAAGEAGVGGTVLAAALPSASLSGNSGRNNSSGAEDGADVVRDPFLRRLALGQRDALLTKALVHALLQRVCVWASVLRGAIKPTVMVSHQSAASLHDQQQQDPAPNISPSPAVVVASSHSTSSAPQSSSWMSWIFGGGSAAKTAITTTSSSSSSAAGSTTQANNNDHSSSGVRSSGGAPYPTVGQSATASSAEVVVGAASLHVLLCLLLFDRGVAGNRGKARNTAVDVIRQLRGMDEFSGSAGLEAANAASGGGSANSGGLVSAHQISPILGGEWPMELVDAVATLVPAHLEASVLLYCLLNDCQSFVRSLTRGAGGAEVHVRLGHLMVDLIRPAVERPSSPESLFLAVVVALLCRVDGVARSIFVERLRAVPSYFVQETSSYVTTSMTVGAFLVLGLTRIVFRASMGDGQASVGAAWLSAFVNISPFAVNLDTAVEQKLVMLFLALLRRVLRLRAEVKANENAFFAAAQLDTAYTHLDLIATGVFQMVADPQRNPTLLYELLYHRDKITAVTASWVEGDAVWRALRPITFLLDKIESEMSSLQEKPRSIPAILEVIRGVGRGNLASGGDAGPVDETTSKVRITLSKENHARSVSNSEAGLASTGRAAGIHFPRVSFIGPDEEVVVTTFDFAEEGVGSFNSGGGNGGGVCEPFFATILWHSILQTDAKVEPPGCLRHSALGVNHNEVFPIFKQGGRR